MKDNLIDLYKEFGRVWVDNINKLFDDKEFEEIIKIQESKIKELLVELAIYENRLRATCKELSKCSCCKCKNNHQKVFK